jgi:uncharacterized UBP type Zn finger protein
MRPLRTRPLCTNCGNLGLELTQSGAQGVNHLIDLVHAVSTQRLVEMKLPDVVGRN